MTFTHLTRVLTVALGLSLAGCAGFDLEAPADFVTLERQDLRGYAMRATNARGVVLAVREVPNDPQGSLAFWKEAISTRLRSQAGYALLEEHEVRAASGQDGVQLRFGREQGSQQYDYWITLFLQDGALFSEDRLYLVEAGGLRDDVALVQTGLEGAIGQFEAW
jgi:hypothetical protein